MAGLEARIERTTCEKVFAKLGILSVKWGVDGWPDRIFLIPGGRPFFIEFKAPGEEPTERQLYRLLCLNTWGYPAVVCDNVEDAFKAVSDKVKESI